MFTCPVCNSDIVPAYGPLDSPVLVVGEFPGEIEMQKGIPFVGKTGGILRQELAVLGVELREWRRCNLWIHPANKNEECLKYSATLVVEEAKGREAILLIGSDTVKFFANKPVSSVAGLRVKCPLLSAPLIMACPNPAMIFKRGRIGEVRMSLTKFVRECKLESVL